MITLSNGHKFDFVAASGALGIDGRGYWWEQPLRWCGLLRPEEFTIVTKTLTFKPRRGNLRMWCPWRCVRRIEGGYVNSVGLSNTGFEKWILETHDKAVHKYGYKIIVSVAPADEQQAGSMAHALSYCRGIKGVELNLSCPNVDHENDVDFMVRLVSATKRAYGGPVIVKLAYEQQYETLCRELDNGYVDAFDLINAVGWHALHDQNTKSPLTKYGLVGGVSGPCMAHLAERVLTDVIALKLKTPVISGGGVYTYEDVEKRFKMGAGAVSFGTLFLRRPWQPNRLVKRWRSEHEAGVQLAQLK